VQQVLRSVEDLVYGLALRSLWHVDDARDCAPEALAAVARGGPPSAAPARRRPGSAPSPLVSIARHRSAGARRPIPAQDLLVDEPETAPSRPGERLVAAERELACASGMLTLLSVPVRPAPVLGDALGPDRAGAALLENGPAAFGRRPARRATLRVRGDLERRLQAGEDRWPRPAAAAQAERAGRAGREPARMLETEPPVGLATPGLAARLRTSYPGLLDELPSTSTSATADAASGAASTSGTA